MDTWYDGLDEEMEEEKFNEEREEEKFNEEMERARSHGEDVFLFALPESSARILNTILWNAPDRILVEDLEDLSDDLDEDLGWPTDEELDAEDAARAAERLEAFLETEDEGLMVRGDR